MEKVGFRKLVWLVGLTAWWSCGQVGYCQEKILWEIGKFDHSSYEFKGYQGAPSAETNPVFIVGKSDPPKDWPARQPGPAVKEFGAKTHPYTILFSLSEPPKGTYHLHIGVILNSPRVPFLRVEANGQAGVFYFRRQTSYYPGDSGIDSPIYGEDQLDVKLPAKALKTGENKLVLTAEDDPKEGEGDSWLAYDALRFAQDPNARLAPAPELTAEPTVFYVNQNGVLAEITYVTATFSGPVRRGEMTLAVAGKQWKAVLANPLGFGEWRQEFAIPEFNGKTEAQVTVRADGKVHRATFRLEPERKWTAYVVPHAHLDIGFTDFQGKVAEIHNRNIDKLLDEIEAHPEMRFSLDGSWIVRQYVASRNQQSRDRLFKLVREGKISVPVQLANLMTGYPTFEELIRSVDYSNELRRQWGLPLEYANITDVPSYTWSYASLLGALGVKYFLAASNNDRAPVLLYGRWNEKSPFWWQGPDGSKVLMSYSRQYFQLSFTCGVPVQEAACRQSLPTFFQQYDSPSYKPDAILMYGTQVENTDLIPGEPEFVKTWNSVYAYPKMVLATFPDYMHYVEQHYGPELATVVGDGGPYWEDGYGTDVRYLAIDRSTQQRAPSAEELATIAAYLHPDVAGPLGEIRRMWDDLVLYAEHTFTSWGGYSRPESEETLRQFAYKDAFATDGRERVGLILDQSLSQLADQIHLAAPAFVVFNSLNWTRSELVETDINADEAILQLPDETPVPVETLVHYPDYNHVRFLARDVPSLGYRCYQIVAAREHPPVTDGEPPMPLSNVIENNYYRIEFDANAAALKSIYDKELNSELVDASASYRFNQYLYVSGGDGETQIVYLRKALPRAELSISPARDGRVTSIRKTSYGDVLSYESKGLHARSLHTDIILFNDVKKIEFVDYLDKEPVNNKEAVYFAFPVAVQQPEFRYEIQSGSVDPAADLLGGANVEWFTVQHWVKVASPGLSVALVPIDSPLITLGDINRGTWPERFAPKTATIFSYVLNNYWHTNFRRVQGGEFTFHYVLTSGRQLIPAELSRFGRAAMTPLELGHLINNDKVGDPPRPLPAGGVTFLQVDAPNVIVEDWKQAEDGNGTIVRLLEVGGLAAEAHLTIPLFDLAQAWITNAAEDNQHELSVRGHSLEISLKPYECVSVRILAVKLRT